VLDACDSFRSKVEMIAWCRRRKLPLVVVGSAGGRTDATQVRVRDLSRTEHDALLALVRKKLRAEFNFPKNATRYFGVPAVYSLENVRYPQADGSVCGTRPAVAGEAALKLDCGAGLARRRTSPAPSRSRRSARRWSCCSAREVERLSDGPRRRRQRQQSACDELQARQSVGSEPNSRQAFAKVAPHLLLRLAAQVAITRNTSPRRAGSLRWPRWPASGWSGESVSISRPSSGMVVTTRRMRRRAVVGHRAADPEQEAHVEQLPRLLLAAGEAVHHAAQAADAAQRQDRFLEGAPCMHDERQVESFAQRHVCVEDAALQFEVQAFDEEIEPALADRARALAFDPVAQFGQVLRPVQVQVGRMQP
jgi:hypothetical protein